MTSTRAVDENKRTYIRLKLNALVKLQAKSGEEYQGRCVDMSGAGLMIATEAPLAVGDQAVARIESKGSEIIYHTTVKRIVDDEGDRRLALAIDEILD